MAFTASVMPRILYEVNEIFQSPSTVDARYAQEVAVAPAVLTRQTARAVPRLTEGKCVGVRVWFYDAGASDTIYEGSTVDGDLTCDNAACGVGATNYIDLDHNIHFHDCKAAQEERCDNELSFAQETARVLYHLMYNMRLAVNKKAINTFVAAAQQNQTPADQMPSYITERAASNILEIDPANMTEANIFNTLVDLNTISLQNSLFQPLLLNGRNFLNSATLAQYNALNDNQRSQQAIYNSLGRNMVWDTHTTHGIDALTSELSTLAVTPNAYLFWNYALYPNISQGGVPILKDASKNLWLFSVEDPMLTYNDGGVQRPVVYDVEHTYDCTGYAANGDRIYLHNYRLFLRGGFSMSPVGFNMAGDTQVYTGAMHFSVTAGGS